MKQRWQVEIKFKRHMSKFDIFLWVSVKCWLLLSSLVSLLSGSTVHSENTYSRILKVTHQVSESQKRISISTNHSYHQLSSSQASLNWSNNKIRFSFNQPNRKRWDARLVDVIKHIPHKAFLLWQHH